MPTRKILRNKCMKPPSAGKCHLTSRQLRNITTKQVSNLICFCKLFACSFAGLDGHTSSQERERLVNRFNATENTDVLLFMLSTRFVLH